MDYLSIGSNGFAQVGQNDYFDKMKVEMAVLIEHFLKKFPVPEMQVYAFYKVKSFPHDFGTYHELCIIYDDRKLEALEISEDLDDNLKHDQFWEWVNAVEMEDLGADEITQEIESKYFERTMEKTIKSVLTLQKL